MEEYIPKTFQWFKERIGKRIYRNSQGECCNHCDETVCNGLIVHDESHADYLASIDSDFAAEGIFSNYRDIK